MAIVKSSALHSWLLRLNFTIFTWQLNIGDWIEAALDWVIYWLNLVLDRAEEAYNRAKAAWDRAGELLAIANNYADRLFQTISTQFETLGSYIDDWWEAKKEWVRTLVDVSASTLRGVIADLTRSLQRLDTTWEEFRHDTLPGLLSFTWFRSWWGSGSATFNDWSLSFRGEVREEREVALDPLRDEVNRHSSWLDMLKEFITDPEDWLYKSLDRIVERFW